VNNGDGDAVTSGDAVGAKSPASLDAPLSATAAAAASLFSLDSTDGVVAAAAAAALFSSLGAATVATMARDVLAVDDAATVTGQGRDTSHHLVVARGDHEALHVSSLGRHVLPRCNQFCLDACANKLQYQFRILSPIPTDDGTTRTPSITNAAITNMPKDTICKCD